MATAILELEALYLPDVIDGLDRYSQARLLVRVSGCPAAWIETGVENGCVQRSAVIEALRMQATPFFWQALAKAQLGTPVYVASPSPSRLPTATIAICTRDRADDLRRCLAGLVQLPDEGQEILVVDSASRTGETQAMAAAFPAVRYVRLERRGLNIARNAALEQAKGEIVVFIDDDAVPDALWLHEHRRAFGNPLTLASMGLTLPLELETEAQEQFEAYSGFSRGFTPHTFHAGNIHPLAAGHTGAGVNMALRRDVCQLIGPFDEALDAGMPTQSGGESELLARILTHHYRIEYTPSALNWHRHRRTLPELRHTIYGYGVGVYAFWTARVLADREWGAAVLGGGWFWHDQLPRLLRSLARRPSALPWPLPWDELRGCVAGPWAYWRARRQLRQEVR